MSVHTATCSILQVSAVENLIFTGEKFSALLTVLSGNRQLLHLIVVSYNDMRKRISADLVEILSCYKHLVISVFVVVWECLHQQAMFLMSCLQRLENLGNRYEKPFEQHYFISP